MKNIIKQPQILYIYKYYILHCNESNKTIEKLLINYGILFYKYLILYILFYNYFYDIYSCIKYTDELILFKLTSSFHLLNNESI